MVNAGYCLSNTTIKKLGVPVKKVNYSKSQRVQTKVTPEVFHQRYCHIPIERIKKVELSKVLPIVKSIMPSNYKIGEVTTSDYKVPMQEKGYDGQTGLYVFKDVQSKLSGIWTVN
ncbi:hypothetical protein HDU92_002335 [Lobulomyces angularis]|nr:hypothetical protein HDU92_002335 [Lobulomyces angularis]